MYAQDDSLAMGEMVKLPFELLIDDTAPEEVLII